MLLPLHPKLREEAKTGHLFKQRSSNLFSIPKVIDSVDNCAWFFTKNAVTYTDRKDKTIVSRTTDHRTGLWEFPIYIQNSNQ